MKISKRDRNNQLENTNDQSEETNVIADKITIID